VLRCPAQLGGSIFDLLAFSSVFKSLLACENSRAAISFVPCWLVGGLDWTPAGVAQRFIFAGHHPRFAGPVDPEPLCVQLACVDRLDPPLACAPGVGGDGHSRDSCAGLAGEEVLLS